MDIQEKFRKLQHNRNWLMTSLKPTEKGDYTATVHFSNYMVMVGFVTDLMRVCALVNEGDTFVAGPLACNRISISGLMEVAVQLMPINECEFLDEAQALLESEKHRLSAKDRRFFLNPPND
jgi:hypothetical protein